MSETQDVFGGGNHEPKKSNFVSTRLFARVIVLLMLITLTSNVQAGMPSIEEQINASALRFSKQNPGDVARFCAVAKARKAMFQKYATQLGVSPTLIAGIMAQECRGNEKTSLRSRYFGPMQVNRSYIRKRNLPSRTVLDGYRCGIDYL